MSRRRKADKREILPDPKFGDLVLSKFMACLMIDGKNTVQKKQFMVHLTELKKNLVMNHLAYLKMPWIK